MLVMVGRHVEERARPIHSEMHTGRSFADSFARSSNSSSSSNAVHNLTSSAHRSPNGGLLLCSMPSELENQARTEFFEAEDDDVLLQGRRLADVVGGFEFAAAFLWQA